MYIRHVPHMVTVVPQTRTQHQLPAFLTHSAQPFLELERKRGVHIQQNDNTNTHFMQMNEMISAT